MTGPPFDAQRSQRRTGLFEPKYANVRSTSRQCVEPEGIAEQPLRQPDTRNTELRAESVTLGNEFREGHNASGRGTHPPLSRVISPSGAVSPYVTMPVMVKIDTSRLRILIQERNMTPRGVSRALGSNDTLVRDILSGKSRSPQALTLAKIADYLSVPLSEFVSGTDRVDGEVSGRSEVSELPMIGPVQAGAWLALDDTGQEDPAMMPAAHDRRYLQAKQWLREVRGDSMNARNIYPGDLAHIVELIGSGVNLNTGMIVEVTRSRDGGLLKEITLKEVDIGERGEVTLWPRSTNPKWKDPIRLDDKSGSEFEVEITGLLLAKITRF